MGTSDEWKGGRRMTQFEQGKWVRIVSSDERFSDLPAKDRKAFVVKVHDDGTAKLRTNSSQLMFDNVSPLDCEKI